MAFDALVKLVALLVLEGIVLFTVFGGWTGEHLAGPATQCGQHHGHQHPR